MQSRLKISSLLAALAVIPAAGAQYQMEFLPRLTDGSVSYAVSVSRNGTIVGVESRPDQNFRGLVWKGTTVSELGGYANTVGLDVSDNDTVVGYAFGDPDYLMRAVVWENGAPKELAGDGYARLATGINDAGTLIVGYMQVDHVNKPVVWEGGTIRELATPNGYGVANDVNNDGDIVGYYLGSNSEVVPCIWKKGSIMPLLSELSHAPASRISNPGRIIGSGQVVRTDADGNQFHLSVGAIWTSTGDVELIERGLKTFIGLSGLNDSGQAVGYLKSSEGDREYSSSGIFEGNDFTPLPSGDSLFAYAMGIAADGMAVGYALEPGTHYLRAVRWTQTGERLRMNVGSGWPGDQVQIEAKVLRNGKPVSNRRVVFQVDGKSAGTGTTDSTGTAKATYQIPSTLSKGKQEFMGSLGGSNYVLKMVSVNRYPTRVNTMMATGKPGGQVSLRAALQNMKTGAWTANQTIVFMQGGKEFARAKTDTRGIATYQYKLGKSVKPGTYTLKARYLGNATHLPFERNLTLVVTAP